MDNELEKQIKNALNGVNPWQRVPTNVKGAFLVKTPSSKRGESFMVEINPTDANGNPIKRRGVFLKRRSELENFMEVMGNDKLKDLMDALENIQGLTPEEELKTVEI
ncbi:hypothetical protein [Methanobacterium aggregans]|uniref:hypothetical protein n=1 Tax=Methanobacterium aggregans TaxID=1615586 RepID=UPI001AE2E8F2|nr:hypothetical protein [Methanobacterium aggregans]MBP2045420.1 hypothetical protein [Methanobacterium aggregans]